MKLSKIIIVSLIILIFPGVCVLGLTIKLGSLAPGGSPWDTNVRILAGEWSKISNGKIQLKVYPGGIAGDESDMLRKMRLGQLDAGLFTVSGLNKVYSGLLTLSLPFLMNNDEEFGFVLEKMQPYFENELEKKGFKVLTWTTGGWIYIFSKKPVVTPDDLRKQKLWAWDAEADEIKAWKELGFTVVTLPAIDVLAGLQTGMIEALTTSPLIAASNQWFGITTHMCDLKYAPIYGALVISIRSWQKIPEDLKPQLMQATSAAGDRMTTEAIAMGVEARELMQNITLTINRVPEEIQLTWKTLLVQGFQWVIGASVDKTAYDMVLDYLEKFRSSQTR